MQYFGQGLSPSPIWGCPPTTHQALPTSTPTGISFQAVVWLELNVHKNLYGSLPAPFHRGSKNPPNSFAHVCIWTLCSPNTMCVGSIQISVPNFILIHEPSLTAECIIHVLLDPLFLDCHVIGNDLQGDHDELGFVPLNKTCGCSTSAWCQLGNELRIMNGGNGCGNCYAPGWGMLLMMMTSILLIL